MRLRVIDLESTGSHPETSEIIEFGAIDVFLKDGGWHIGPLRSCLLRPNGALTPETQAIHHLTASDFKPWMQVATPEVMRALTLADPSPDILVAHHIAFEQYFLTPELTNGLPWICTLKTAQKLWPEAPRHTNQVLRYWLKLDLDAKLATPPHRAGPDAYVTAHILLRQLEHTSLDTLLLWSRPKPARRGDALRAGHRLRQTTTG